MMLSWWQHSALAVMSVWRVNDRAVAAVSMNRFRKACINVVDGRVCKCVQESRNEVTRLHKGAVQSVPCTCPTMSSFYAGRAVQGMPKAAAAPAEAIAGAVRSIALGVRNGLDPERYEERLLNRASR